MKNPLSESLINCMNQLVSYKGSLHFLEKELIKSRKSIIENHSEESINRIMLGHRLAITDLSEFPADGWRRYYPAPGLFGIEGKEYLNFTDSVIERESAWVTSQCYETLEIFIKNILSSFFQNNQIYIEHDKMQKFLSAKEIGYEMGTVEDYKEFLSYSYRGKNNRKLIMIIKKVSPEFSELLTKNNRGIYLAEWYEVFSEVRHAVTHMRLILPNETVENFSPDQKNYLNVYFPVENCSSGFRLKMNRKSVESNVNLTAEFAYLIFKCLSNLRNYGNDIM